MIDIMNENLISLKQAARLLPTGRRERPTAFSTILRWVQLGGRTQAGVEVLTGLRDGEQIVVPAVASRGAE